MTTTRPRPTSTSTRIPAQRVGGPRTASVRRLRIAPIDLLVWFVAVPAFVGMVFVLLAYLTGATA